MKELKASDHEEAYYEVGIDHIRIACNYLYQSRFEKMYFQ